MFLFTEWEPFFRCSSSLCSKCGYNLYLTWGLHFLQFTLPQKNIPMVEKGRKSLDDVVGSVVHTSEDTNEQNKHLMSDLNVLRACFL